MPAPPQSYRVAAAWTLIVAIGVLSLLPKEEMVRTGLGGHIEHVLAYAGTAAVVAYAYGVRRAPVFTVGLIAYAGVLEFLQRFSPGRVSSIEDFAFSAIGVLLGLALFAIADWIVPLAPGDA